MDKNSRLIGLFLLVLSQNVLATEYFVSPGGNNSDNGSLATPWLTIQHAADALSPGDTAFVRDGTYHEAITLNVSGAVDAPISLRAFPDEHPIVDGSTLTVPAADNGLFLIDSQNHIIIDGFELRNYSTAVTSRVPIGIFVTGTSHHIQLRNNRVHDIKALDRANGNAHGIAVYGTQVPTAIHDVIIDSNELFNLQLGNSEALVLNGNVTDFIVTNNRVHDNDNIGLDFIGFEQTASDPTFDQARDGIVTGNLVYNINSVNNPAYNGEKSAGGIYVDGGTRIIIERNTVHDSNIGIEIASEHPGRSTSDITLRNNLIYDNHIAGIAMGGYDTQRGSTDHCKIINNTLFHNDSDQDGNGELYIQFDTRNNVVKNNIFVANAQTLLISNAYTQNFSNVVDHNLYFAGENAVDSEWQWKNIHYQGFSHYQSATGNDENSAFNDPLFLDASIKDFHLSSTSPAIDSGDNTADTGALDHDSVTRIVGSAVDNGALEYGNTTPFNYSLPPNQWKQIALPCDPGSSATINQLFADDIPGTYGTDWIIYEYDPASGYIDPGLNGILKQGVGYWIVQENGSGSTATIDLPASCLSGSLSVSSQCPSTTGCFEIPIATASAAVQWNMVGHPFVRSDAWNDVVVATSNGSCADTDGCTLSEASDARIVHYQGFQFNPDTNAYNILAETGDLKPFDGLWMATLDGADGSHPRLLIPDTTIVPTVPALLTGEQSMDVGGVQRWFNVVRSANVESQAPLVILLHGGFGDMRSILANPGVSDWVDIAAENAFLLIAPNGTDANTGDPFTNQQHWNDQRAPYLIRDSDVDDVSFILDIIDWGVDNHQINRAQVFVTGLSNGGMMTFRMLTEAADEFLAGAAFIANLPTDNPLITNIKQPVPVMFSVGTDDPLMPFEGGNISSGGRGTVRSSADTRDWWINQNNAALTSTQTTLPDTDPSDNCLMIQNDYAATANGATVRMITLQGGGHAMASTDPNASSNFGPQCRDADGTRMAWSFFQNSIQ